MAAPRDKKKPFVSALMIAFFPAGFYRRWKGARLSRPTKAIITILVLAPVVWGLFRASSNHGRFVTAGASTRYEGDSDVRRMGISYRQAIQGLTGCVPMEPGAPVDGQIRHHGTTDDHTVSIEIIGDPQAITEARMVIVPTASPDIEVRNLDLLHRFLANIIPQWQAGADWMTAALKNVTDPVNPEPSQATVHGYKKISVSAMKPSHTLIVTIKHA